MNPTASARVLFVDDDPQVLDGLRRALRGKRHDWHMTFAAGGEAALADMERIAPDVVVSDMRMPGIDGLTLLRRTAVDHPATVRILLSGQTGQAAATAAVPVAHQFISKPCDAHDLTRVLERLELARAVLPAGLDAIVGQTMFVPAPHDQIEAVRDALEAHDLERAASAIASDASLAGAALRLANSAFCGRGRAVADARVAARSLGAQSLLDALVTPALARPLDGRTAHLSSSRVLRAHAIGTARLAASMFDDPGTQGVAWTAGLLHTVGALALATELPDRYRSVLERIERGDDAAESERRVFGATHGAVGAALLTAWGLPDVLADACLGFRDGRTEAAESWGVVAAVRLAAVLAAECLPPGVGSVGDRLDHAWVERLGVTSRIAGWRAGAASVVDAAVAKALVA
jgi:HD-like signal output (HDOD) protein